MNEKAEISPKKLCILILQYNSADLTIDLLETLVEHEGDMLPSYSVIVMDNNSEDSKKEKIQDNFPFIEFVEFDSNLGFAGAHNKIIDRVKEEYILLLNNDCLLKNDAIHRTLRLHIQYGAGYSTCDLLNSDGTHQINFSNIPSPWRRIAFNIFALNRRYIKSRLNKDISSVGYINGAFLLMKAELFRSVGAFTDEYFMYTEDLDLMIKLNKAKKKGYRFTSGKVVHLGGSSANKVWVRSEIRKMQAAQIAETFYRHYRRFPVSMWLLLFVVKNTVLSFFLSKDSRGVGVIYLKAIKKAYFG